MPKLVGVVAPLRGAVEAGALASYMITGHPAFVAVSPAFEGQSRVERQRLVYHALREEFDTGLHALSLDLKTPAEAAKTA
ncbi:MAG: BolA/IbaG family iron-sulfur metabolism protein [Proteobacteria bacterium]|nr:BolA/IbaG family iron-sulfur metabolism protein [Pseudomonadota bacterium]